MRLLAIRIRSEEPLRLQLSHFLMNVRQRSSPLVGGKEGQRVLLLANQILHEIARHSNQIGRTFAAATFPFPDEREAAQQPAGRGKRRTTRPALGKSDIA